MKTWKLLTMHSGFHLWSLYTSQKEGRHSVVNIKATVLDVTQSIQEYSIKMTPKNELLRECLRQQQGWEEDQEEEMLWQDKILHRMYY